LIEEPRWRERWCKQCIHLKVNAKMIPVEAVPGTSGGDEGRQWRG
jgi:hypothetical protein